MVVVFPVLLFGQVVLVEMVMNLCRGTVDQHEPEPFAREGRQPP